MLALLCAPPPVRDRAHKRCRKVDRQNQGEGVNHRTEVGRKLAYPHHFHSHTGQAGQEEKWEQGAARFRSRGGFHCRCTGLSPRNFPRHARQQRCPESDRAVAQKAHSQRLAKAQHFDQQERQKRSCHCAGDVRQVEITERPRGFSRHGPPNRTHRHRDGCAHQGTPGNQSAAHPETRNTVVGRGRAHAQIFQNAASPGEFVRNDECRYSNQQFNESVEPERARMTN